MTHTHLTDDQLIAMCVDTSDAPDDAQPSGCALCEQRRAALESMLDEVGTVATAAADAAFPTDRLARQHDRIMHRVDMVGHVGRVIAFPAPPPARVTSLRPTPVRRWIAGAAAAGLLIGMAAGHLVHEMPAFGRAPASPQASLGRGSVQFVNSSSAADAEFLQEIETAVSSGPAGLRRLDQITPIVWSEPR
jgi:hypothetical protein